MSSLRFPVIETKKNLGEEEDYNFVNKDKKKKATGNPLELIEELKRKIQDQKKEIDNRNITIQGLQRNFESLSVIVKNQKTLSASLRAELEGYRTNAETGDRRAAEFHEKNIQLEKELKAAKDDLKGVKKSLSDCQQYVTLSEELKRRLAALEETNQKLHGKLMQTDGEKKSIESELNKLRGSERDKRLLNEKIVDLQEQLRKAGESNNALTMRVGVAGEELARAKGELNAFEKKIEEAKMKAKEIERQRERAEGECESLRRQNSRLSGQIFEVSKSMENKDLFSKLKQEEEEKLKKDYRSLFIQYSQLEETYKKVLAESEEKTELLSFSHSELGRLKSEFTENRQQFQQRQREYRRQIDKLNHSLAALHNQLGLSTGESSTLASQLTEQRLKSEDYSQRASLLNDRIQEMNRQIQDHQLKYGRYLKLIAANEPDVVITNERELSKLENTSAVAVSRLQGEISHKEARILELENTTDNQASNIQTMRKYIKSLEEEVGDKNRELLQKNRLLRKYQDEEEELNSMVESQRLASLKAKQLAEELILSRMQELQGEKARTQKEIEEQKTRLQRALKEERERNEDRLRKEQQKAMRLQSLLQQYKNQEQQLKEMMVREQVQLAKLSKQKQEQIARAVHEKQEQLQKQRKNNKMLWSDNKKLKDLENKLRDQSTRQLEQKEAARRQEMERLRLDLERKYKEEMGSMQAEESSSKELKRILQERTNQYNQLNESLNKSKAESEFYRNRTKELEALVSRTQKQFKQKIVDLEREAKSGKIVSQTLQRKLKQAELAQADSQKRQKKELKYLYEEIEQMRERAKTLRTEEKLALLNKSAGDMQTALKALLNAMSCNYCVQVAKECVRLQCGHIYCRGCKGGYQPNCGECKRKGTAVPDKVVDNSVSRAEYMQALLMAMREELGKMG